MYIANPNATIIYIIIFVYLPFIRRVVKNAKKYKPGRPLVYSGQLYRPPVAVEQTYILQLDFVFSDYIFS